MSDLKTYRVTGNTFGRKNKIKKADGKYEPTTKSWIVELYKSDSLFRYSDLVFTEISDAKKDGWTKDAWNEVINEGSEGYQL